MEIGSIRKLEYLALITALVVTMAAMVFYWTRYWIQFTADAVPWLLYPLIPYVALGGLGYLLNRKRKLKRRAVITLVGSVILLLLTLWFYVPFMNGSLVFYLRQSLGMSGIVLGVVSVVFIALSWVSGLWVLGEPPSNNQPQATQKTRA